MGFEGDVPIVEQAGRGKPLLRRPSLKKGLSGSLGSEPRLLYCKRVQSRVEARDALGKLLSANEAATQTANSTEAERLATSLPKPRELVIVLECTEEPVPWNAALGGAASCLKILRCRRGFLPEEALEEIASLFATGTAHLIVITGTPKCQHLCSSIKEWQTSEQNWRLPPPQPPTLRTPGPAFSAPQHGGKSFWGNLFSCMGSGQQPDGSSALAMCGQVAPTLTSPHTSEDSTTTEKSAAESQEELQEAAQDAFVPAIETVAAELYLGPHKRSLTMQLEQWDEKPANGQRTLVRQISADTFCANHMRDRRRKDTLQADDATLAKVLNKHSVLLSQLLLKKLSKRLEQAVISNVEVVPVDYDPESHQLSAIRRSWYSGRCYFHE